MESGIKKNYTRYREFFLNIWRLYNTKPSLKIYLELILSISTIAVFAVFAIKPTVLTIIDLNKEINAKEESVLKLKQKVKNLQIANNILQTEESKLLLIDQAVPSNPTPETLIKQMETLASQSLVQLLSFSISEVNLVGKKEIKKKSSDLISLPEGSSELSFTFSATGQYINLLNLVKGMENLRRPIKIDSFLLNANVSETNKDLTLTIAGRVPFIYYEKK